MIAGETIAAATPALANNGQAVLQGTDNGTPTARTAVHTANEVGALADPDSGKGSLGVYGKGQSFGVLGEAATGSGGTGVQGTGDGTGFGLIGISTHGTGVLGEGGGSGVSGIGVSGPGVVGNSGLPDGPGVAGFGGYPDGNVN